MPAPTMRPAPPEAAVNVSVMDDASSCAADGSVAGEDPQVYSECSEPADSIAGDLAELAEDDSHAAAAGQGAVSEVEPVEHAEHEEHSISAIDAEVNTASFTELVLPPGLVLAAQDSWRLFMGSASSRDAAGEAIYRALFESAPSLQSLFTTPRAVQAMRFMNGLNNFVSALDDPPALKTLVETLGFGHLNLDVTVPRVIIFRDAILDLLQVELGPRLTGEGHQGWKRLLNYVGGAIIFIKKNFAENLRILAETWAICNKKEEEQAELAGQADGDEDKHGGGAPGTPEDADGGTRETKKSDNFAQRVPTTYKDMFLFNAAVMGLGDNLWMREVLDSFDNIVTHVANSSRLQEECDVLVLRIATCTTETVNLPEYKSCMLASLRSLLPKDWTTAHEVAWSWLWENVARLLLKTMGQPVPWARALARFLDSLEEAAAYELRQEIYCKFFGNCPHGQDYFKQSNAYLHIIATKIMTMSLHIYKDPVQMTDDISALGLRHVGYGIPTELFGPFITACIEVVGVRQPDELVTEAFRWSLGLMSKMLVRIITEGSTLVMKAINLNNSRSLRKALSCAPRGQRSSWMLKVQVGNQSISPLEWAIQSGSFEAAEAMVQDLLTFRADRDKYYYSAEQLFSRHEQLVSMLCDEAPALLATLFDGLTWRSRLTSGGYRRVNYYLQYLLVDSDGKFAKTLHWINKLQDPVIVCHPVLVVLADVIWSKVAFVEFFLRKSWFLFTLHVFVISQSVLEHQDTRNEWTRERRALQFALRCVIYFLSMGQLLYRHVVNTIRCVRSGDTFVTLNITIPGYLRDWQSIVSMMLLVCLYIMFASEPVLTCWSAATAPGHENTGDLFTADCKEAETTKFFPYSFFAMVSMFMYFLLLMDFSVIHTKIAAYTLVCGRILSEVFLFVLALAATIIAHASSLSCLYQEIKAFKGIPSGFIALFEMVLGMYSAHDWERMHQEPFIILGANMFLIMAVIFLLNMLIAQICCAYKAIYDDMVGYARLKRVQIINETTEKVSPKKWGRFLDKLKLDQKLEFNEGDVGVAGGIQVLEAASANPTTIDQIHRYGGSTNQANPWPEEVNDDEGEDKLERLEKLVVRTLARFAKNESRRKKKEGGNSGSGASAEDSGASPDEE